MALLVAKDVSRCFGGEPVFSGVSFELRRGQSLAVVSPSGTGKSTLLSILGLLQNKSSGTLLLAGQDADRLKDAEKAQLRRLKLGFVFQHTQLVGSLRALDNVLAPARLLHRGDVVEWAPGGQMPKWQAFEERARELLEGFGLGGRIHHFPHQLSVGQKRRVAVARALLLGAPVILADEPTNDLDAASAEVVADALFARVVGGCALVFATHDPALASRADAVLELGEPASMHTASGGATTGGTPAQASTPAAADTPAAAGTPVPFNTPTAASIPARLPKNSNDRHPEIAEGKAQDLKQQVRRLKPKPTMTQTRVFRQSAAQAGGRQ